MVDFVFGLVKWHSVVAGIVAIAGGLPLTGLFFLIFGASWKGNGDSGASGAWRQGATMIAPLHSSTPNAWRRKEPHPKFSQFLVV